MARADNTALTMPAIPLAFHLMAKPTGAICNLDCEYCFFLSKEMLYPGSRFRMAAELQETYIRQLLAAHERAPEVVVAWQGGEPTMMGLDFFRRSIELEREYARPGQRVLNTIQTNGTLLDDDWGAFLREHDFLVGISIDGPRPLHDAYRVDKGGKPTYDRVIRGLDVLRRHNVDWNVLTTIHAANGDHGRRVYTFLRDELDATFIQFIPIVERVTEQERDGHLVTRRSVGPSQYGRFLIDVFEEWVRRDIGAVYVQMFDTALASFHGQPSGMSALVGANRTSAAAGVRAGQTIHAAPLLPGLRCQVRLQRRLPEGQVRDDARRRTGAALPVRGLQGLLPPCQPADAGDVRPAPGRPAGCRPDGQLRHGRREARPQRPVQLRQRPQVETLPRSPAPLPALVTIVDVFQHSGGKVSTITTFHGVSGEVTPRPPGRARCVIKVGGNATVR